MAFAGSWNEQLARFRRRYRFDSHPGYQFVQKPQLPQGSRAVGSLPPGVTEEASEGWLVTGVD